MMSRVHGIARKAITLRERIATAGIAAGATAILAAGAPLAAVLFLRNHAIGLLDVYAGFPHWGLATAALAGTAGFACGADRTLVLSHHLFLTARPRHAWLTAGLWAALLLCAGAAMWLS
jgi:hypothetical protein